MLKFFRFCSNHIDVETAKKNVKKMQKIEVTKSHRMWRKEIVPETQKNWHKADPQTLCLVSNVHSQRWKCALTLDELVPNAKI